MDSFNQQSKNLNALLKKLSSLKTHEKDLTQLLASLLTYSKSFYGIFSSDSDYINWLQEKVEKTSKNKKIWSDVKSASNLIMDKADKRNEMLHGALSTKNNLRRMLILPGIHRVKSTQDILHNDRDGR